jgi:hypothetical protein
MLSEQEDLDRREFSFEVCPCLAKELETRLQIPDRELDSSPEDGR